MNGVRQVEAVLLQSLHALDQRIEDFTGRIEESQSKIAVVVNPQQWHSTSEVAELMGGTRHTVWEWRCNHVRIECVKDLETGKWKIPGHEYERLRRGGRPAAAMATEDREKAFQNVLDTV